MCPRCGGGGSRLEDGRHGCEPCHRRVSITTGTVFHGTRTPLTVWFAVAWYMTSSKNGVAALTLHRLLGFGSYQTVWAIMHRLRIAMVRPGRDRLAGVVEVDETLFGGVRPGKPGRGAAGKVLVAVAIERHEPKGFGRCRLRVIPNAKTGALDPFLRDSIEPGSTVVTDGLKSYPQRSGPTTSTARSTSPARACKLMYSSRVCIGSLVSPSDGCWAPIKGRWREILFRPTLTSSRSASTGDSQSSADFSSAGFWSRVFRLDPFRTTRWWSIPYPRASHLYLQEAATGFGRPPSQQP